MKTFLKLCAFFLAAAMLLSLAGCGEDPVALSYKGVDISTNMYRYWLSSYKGTFMYAYTDMNDTDAFWNSILFDNVTAEEYLNGAVVDNVKRNLVCLSLFEECGLSLSDSDLAGIDTYINELVQEYADGSRRSFNQMLAQYGINLEILREIYIIEEKISLLFSYLYTENGPFALTEETLDAYYRQNYARVRHIYVNDAYAYEKNDAGHYVYDTSGSAVTRALTKEELAEKQAKIAAIDKALAEGTDFAKVYEEYSEDLYYENGYYFTKETDFIDEVVDAAFSLEIGKTTTVKSEFGTHYLMRLPLENYAYNDPANADFFDGFAETVKNDDLLHRLNALLPEVTVYEEEIKKYSIRDAAVNYAI